jgi:hypothetical protein
MVVDHGHSPFSPEKANFSRDEVHLLFGPIERSPGSDEWCHSQMAQNLLNKLGIISGGFHGILGKPDCLAAFVVVRLLARW